MRLFELTRPTSMIDVFDVMKRAGYSEVGAGSCGSVWAKPGAPHVIKLFQTADVGYSKFVRLARQHPNPHFPRFFGDVFRLNDRYSGVRMERLLPPTEAWVTQGTDGPAYSIENYIEMRIAGETSSSEELDQLFAKYPDLQAACDLIAENLHGHRIDLHDQNFMLRGDVPVIIDPVTD